MATCTGSGCISLWWERKKARGRREKEKRVCEGERKRDKNTQTLGSLHLASVADLPSVSAASFLLSPLLSLPLALSLSFCCLMDVTAVCCQSWDAWRWALLWRDNDIITGCPCDVWGVVQCSVWVRVYMCVCVYVSVTECVRQASLFVQWHERDSSEELIGQLAL